MKVLTPYGAEQRKRRKTKRKKSTLANITKYKRKRDNNTQNEKRRSVNNSKQNTAPTETWLQFTVPNLTMTGTDGGTIETASVSVDREYGFRYRVRQK